MSGLKPCVVVRSGKDLWVCRPDPTGWRCGKCLRGLVLPKKGDKCRVCGARVFEVPAGVFHVVPRRQHMAAKKATKTKRATKTTKKTATAPKTAKRQAKNKAGKRN